MNTRARHSVPTLLLAAALAGCAAGPGPVPEGYAGPTAVISDTATGGGNARGGKFYSLVQVDGGAPLRTSLDKSRSASFGQGFRLNVVGQQWRVKAGPAKLKLTARVAYGAPIQEIFAGSRMRSIEGVVDVVLKEDGRYVVTGSLDPYRTEVWLEDDVTHEVVGEKISTPPDKAALARTIAGGKFTCCNLHYDSTISDENFASLPFVPVGARAAITGFGRKTVDVLIEGRPMELQVYIGDNVPGRKVTPQELAAQFLVDTDPAPLLATYPADVQSAIRSGKVMLGMTRPQVLMAIGYPWIDKTPSLDSKEWSFHVTDREEYTVVWGSDGRVQAVEGLASVKRQVMP